MNDIRQFADAAEEIYLFSISAAWDQHRRYPHLSLPECLAKRTMLWSFLHLIRDESDPLRLKLLDHIGRAGSPAEMKIHIPAIRQYAADHMQTLRKPPPEYPDGTSVHCVRLANPGWGYLHFYNGKRPLSFLDFPRDFAGELLNKLDDCEKNLGCETIYTATWLNELPRFLYFFPEEWIANMSPPPAPEEILPTNGYQGQFYNAAGFLNRKTADYLLKNGVLKYRRRESHCSIASMRKHLCGILADS